MRAAATRRSINSESIACIKRCVRSRKIGPEEILVDACCIRELTSHDQITDDESLDKGHRWVTIIVEMFLCWKAYRTDRRDLSGGCETDCTTAVKERISEFLKRIVEDQITMGKGDKRTRRGKIWRGTYGKRRPKPRKSRKEAKKK